MPLSPPSWINPPYHVSHRLASIPFDALPPLPSFPQSCLALINLPLPLPFVARGNSFIAAKSHCHSPATKRCKWEGESCRSSTDISYNLFVIYLSAIHNRYNVAVMDGGAERDVERIHLIKRTIGYSVDRLRNCRQQLPAPSRWIFPNWWTRAESWIRYDVTRFNSFNSDGLLRLILFSLRLSLSLSLFSVRLLYGKKYIFVVSFFFFLGGGK